MNALGWIEQTGLSIWFREALWAFPTLLVIHALGMAFLVGASVAVNLRLLGLGAGIALSAMSSFFTVLYWGFLANLVSGLALLWTYPAKALTNPLFFIKLGLVAFAVILSRVQQQAIQNPTTDSITIQRPAAVTILLLWTAAIASGRLLAYTHSVLLVS